MQQPFSKQDIRKQVKLERFKLGQTEIDQLSKKLASRLLPFLKRYSVLHSFIPITRLNEVNTLVIREVVYQHFPDIRWLSSQIEQGSMRSVIWDKDTPLHADELGILSPKNPEYTDLIPDIVLIPLLATDAEGRRLGYGKGFYDKYLATLPDTSLRIGLNFYPPMAFQLPEEPHDVSLHYLIEPENTHSFV